jgi:hypothetical protein
MYDAINTNNTKGVGLCEPPLDVMDRHFKSIFSGGPAVHLQTEKKHHYYPRMDKVLSAGPICDRYVPMNIQRVHLKIFFPFVYDIHRSAC